MQFLRPPRDRIRNGEITTTVRLWQRPHVRVGGRYALPPAAIVVTNVFEVSLADITPESARDSGLLVLLIFSKWPSMVPADVFS
jgi:hypothetical protein